jgi:hypothetical protein
MSEANYYGTIYHEFWTGPTGRAITAGGLEVRVLATYLLTNRFATMIGLYRLVPYDIFTETGLTRAEVAHAFHYLDHIEFATYDAASEHVWVPQMATYRLQLHRFKPLKATDKRVKGAQNLYDRLGDNPFLETFFKRYAKDVRLKKARRSTARKITPLHADKEPVAPHRKAHPLSGRPLKGLQGSDGPMKTAGAREQPSRNHEGASSPLKGQVSPLKPVTGTGTYVPGTSTSGVPSHDRTHVPPEYIVTGAGAPAHTPPVENPKPGEAYATDAGRSVAPALCDRDGPTPHRRPVSDLPRDGGGRRPGPRGVVRGLVRVGGTDQMAARAAPAELPGSAAPLDQGDGGGASRVAEAHGRHRDGGSAPAREPTADRTAEPRSAVAEKPAIYGGLGLDADRPVNPAAAGMIANIREAQRRHPRPRNAV